MIASPFFHGDLHEAGVITCTEYSPGVTWCKHEAIHSTEYIYMHIDAFGCSARTRQAASTGFAVCLSLLGGPVSLAQRSAVEPVHGALIEADGPVG